MNSEVLVFGLLIIYKVATLIAGVFVIYMGYKLFSSRIQRTAGELEAKASGFSLVFRTAAPGTFFALFGALIIGVSVFRGASYVPKAADVHISDIPSQTSGLQILIPSSPPASEGAKKVNSINVLTLLTILLYGSTPFAQTAQTPEEVYGDAIKSLNAGDCQSALLHLEKYQAMAAAKLQSHPEFKGKIDAQRQICLKRLADAGKITPGIYGEKPNVRSIRGVDNEANKTIELRPR